MSREGYVTDWLIASRLLAQLTLAGLLSVALLSLGLAGTAVGSPRVAEHTGFNYDEPVGIAQSSGIPLARAVAPAAGSNRASPAVEEATGHTYDLLATFVAPRPTSGFIDPGDVRFSQADASLNFSDGGTVSDLSAGLRSGVIDPSDVPPIRLAEIDGQLFSLDNRRLIAFGNADVPVPYRMTTADEIAAEAFKFTTTNGGTSIQLRLFSPFRYQGGPR